jgi:hypothetical protein
MRVPEAYRSHFRHAGYMPETTSLRAPVGPPHWSRPPSARSTKRIGCGRSVMQNGACPCATAHAPGGDIGHVAWRMSQLPRLRPQVHVAYLRHPTVESRGCRARKNRGAYRSLRRATVACLQHQSHARRVPDAPGASDMHRGAWLSQTHTNPIQAAGNELSADAVISVRTHASAGCS